MRPTTHDTNYYPTYLFQALHAKAIQGSLKFGIRWDIKIAYLIILISWCLVAYGCKFCISSPTQLTTLASWFEIVLGKLDI